MDASEIDLIVLATATPDQTFPATATIVQDNLGCNGCVAFDVAAVCSGFLYALSVAESMIRAGSAKNAIVIGAETFSRILDWEDRTTCVLFGDGAGAIVLSGETGDKGVLSTRLHADGAHNQLLYVDGGAGTTGTVGKLRMKGREVFRHAVVNLSSVLHEALSDASVEVEDVDWVVPHQANERILDATAKKAWPASGESNQDRGPAREYFRRFCPTGVGRCCQGWQSKVWRPSCPRSNGWRFYMGCCSSSVLIVAHRIPTFLHTRRLIFCLVERTLSSIRRWA